MGEPLGRRFRPYLLVALAVLCLTPSGAAGLDRDPKVFSLQRGEAVFVQGPRIDRASGNGCNAGNCKSFRFDLSRGGWRLRVGIDHPDHHDQFGLELLNPAGKRVAGSQHRFLETPELLVPGPEAGTWTLNVIATDVRSTSYLIRAKLETEPPAIQADVENLPNLRPEPAFDFMFTTPVGSNYGVSGPASISCHPDEVAEDQAVRCLRFAFGYHNAGDGPLDLRFEPFSAATVSAAVRQRIYRGDKTVFNYDDNKYRERPAGTATYHEVHGHYHYDAVFQAEVFRVDDLERGELSPIGPAEKRGACAHDWVLVDFHRFYQDMAGTADSGTDCSFGFTNPTSNRMRIGLSRGWADIYTAELSDNYANFGLLNEDGIYLVRVTSDPDDLIQETSERDNYAYSLIEIAGDKIVVRERGRGLGPWDERKVLTNGLG